MSQLVSQATQQLRQAVEDALRQAMAAGELPQADLPEFILEVPGDSAHGDWACNAAMAGARTFHAAPRKIAQSIVDHLDLAPTYFEKVEIAGPGFLNFTYRPAFYAGVLQDIHRLGQAYGRSDAGQGQRVLVEYVSANPTGPMHIGNARGGVLGDALSAVLEAAGYQVSREFYINDAGNQVNKYAASLEARYLQLYQGEEAVPFPEDGYQGPDVIANAKSFAELNGDKYVSVPSEERKAALIGYALPKNIQGLHDDLLRYRVEYDNWFHESTLHENGAVGRVVELLKEKGATYEKDGAVWFHGEEYGSEDFVLVRSNGVPTYVVPDIAYHYDKLVTRHFDLAIDVLGADHHGYVPRLKAALTALGVDASRLEVVLMQMVRLVRDGEIVKASKRSGKAITLVTLLEEVPVDAARFLFNSYEPNTRIDFDLDLAVQEDSQNPVYYVQYAHARICSILKKLESEGVAFRGLDAADAAALTDPSELALLRLLAAFPAEIAAAAEKYDPARITRFVIDVAGAFHRFYGACRILGAEDSVQQARIALCLGVRDVIRNALTMFKINVPESM
ncbi:MAG TPA: arginine--tRNA ligase [Candidatus Acutalibacter stercorigallinarum]|nr:arginine--tRNA ligase [Candidatus Acutalibacter stercorigallinarum]